MELQAWYDVVKPREDLREGKPLDASEFAVHLDQVRDGRAPDVYKVPQQFFERTYLTQNLSSMASEVMRRLSGVKVETNAVFNMATQFGGGKTHALTLLYHLAKHGPDASNWPGVQELLSRAGINAVPKAECAVFVGTEFDPLLGRGGADGTPHRSTPWGEIAFQLGGPEALAILGQHEEQLVAPGGDVIRRFLPADRPCLILIDELMNYISRSRQIAKVAHMQAQMYNFLQNLSEEARARDNLVLAVSIPTSELEMTADDYEEYMRVKKLLDRLGKAVVMSAEHETSEIIRRRLFEWKQTDIGWGGKVLLPKAAMQTCEEYAKWVVEHRQQLPEWFAVDSARERFAATYPFHPTALSVFERKWQALPTFQQTRGVLRMLALWVSYVYSQGYRKAFSDPLITLGTAPLEDPTFRQAVFEQLGERKLEAAVTTDICGSKDAHATRLDAESVDAIRKSRLHRKVATSIFFESNGGQAQGEATVPEIRLDVAEPGLDIGNVETVLEALTPNCYFLTVDRNRYKFGLKANLNKISADRRASIQQGRIDERVRAEIITVFGKGGGVERVFFPNKSSEIPDRPALTLVVMPPEPAGTGGGGLGLSTLDRLTKEYGASARIFKSALIWALPDVTATLYDEARKLLAWEAIQDEQTDLRLDDVQRRQLEENLQRSKRDLLEAVWRTYSRVVLLDKDSELQELNLGLIHSSAAATLTGLIVDRLKQQGQIEDVISPNFLVRNWPPAFKEWSTKAVRDAFFASPRFPRLTSAEGIKDTIARGVAQGLIAYVGKVADGKYAPFFFEGDVLPPREVEISDEMYIVTAEDARKSIEPRRLEALSVLPQHPSVKPGEQIAFFVKGRDQHDAEFDVQDIKWNASGGTIDQDGYFTAGPLSGSFSISAMSSGLSNHTMVTVKEDSTIIGPDPGPEPPPMPDLTTIHWAGEVPAQKWTNFYMKVLTRLVQNGQLKLTVTVEATPEPGVVLQKAQDMKVALRELGLDAEVVVD